MKFISSIIGATLLAAVGIYVIVIGIIQYNTSAECIQFGYDRADIDWATGNAKCVLTVKVDIREAYTDYLRDQESD